jgi:hypothetical protein
MLQHDHTEKHMTVAVMKTPRAPKSDRAKPAPSPRSPGSAAKLRAVEELVASIRERAEALSANADRLLARLS